MRIIHICSTLLILIFSITVTRIASADSHNVNVLILNSYHQGYNWTDDETRGIIKGVSPANDRIKIYIEYMGTKWASDAQYFSTLRNMYKSKFKSTRIDLILATDNDAFDFLRNYRDEVFGKKPVVFCGVNWFQPEQLNGQSLYTGVNESVDISKNLDLMLDLHPAVRRVYVLVDRTTTGKIIKEHLDLLALQYAHRLEIQVIDDLEMDQILKLVSTLHKDSLVLVTAFNKDRAGKIFEPDEVAQLLSRNSRVPVYGLWDFHLTHGIVGGFLTSGEAQGESAGKMALRIINGQSVNSIPVMMDQPNSYLFDWVQLKRFGIHLSDMPLGSRIVNEPPSFYRMNKGLVWGLLGSIFFLSLFTIYLLLTILRRKKAEEALQISEVKYHTLVDNLTLGVYRNSGMPKDKFLQVNPALVHILGYDSAEELMDASVSSLYDDPLQREQIIDEIAAKGSVKNKEILMRKKNRAKVWININARATFTDGGVIAWMDGIVEDITERKELETQLRQAQKMDALGTLAGGIAHDFNNILTGIIGYGNLLLMKLSPVEGLRYYADEILKASNRAASLTRSLLSFSRKHDIVVKPLQLNELVENFRKFLTRIIGEDLELKITYSTENPIILADSGQIEQILMNLVINARDAMPDGGSISISTSVKEIRQGTNDPRRLDLAPGKYAELAIADTGTGIEESIRNKIFEPFFTTKELNKGTGLGLSIIYGIVKQHKGDIHVQSEVGRGTTFSVYLPLITAESIAVESDEDLVLPRGEETILLVEDDPTLSNLQNEVLRGLGYKVLATSDGETAVTMLKQQVEKIDLVFTDVVLPKRNGKQVYEEAKRLKPTIKVLFTSGSPQDVISRHRILEEGLPFLVKPATPQELAKKVRSVLDRTPQ